MLDVRDGVVLAFDLFGASVFGSRRSLPEGFQIEHSVRRLRQRGDGIVCPEIWDFWGAKNEPKMAQVCVLGR